MIPDVAYHCDTCARCISNHNTYEHVGISKMAAQRFKVIEIDFWDIPADYTARVGHTGVLTIVDRCHGKTLFVSSRSSSSSSVHVRI